MELKSLEELQKYNKQQFEKLGVKEIVTSKTEEEISDYWERINFNSRPHDVFSTDWNNYYSIDFADALLSYADGITATALNVFDGAELFAKIPKADKKLYLLAGSEKPINIVAYTFPEGVKADSKKKYVKADDNELLAFFKINKENSIDINFKLGKNISNIIDSHAKENKLNISSRSIENNVYQTTKEDLRKNFSNSLLQYDKMKFFIETTNTDFIPHKMKEIKNYILNGFWTDLQNKKIKMAHVEDTVRFCLETNLPKNEIIEIELYDFDGNIIIPTFLGYLVSRIFDDKIPLVTTDKNQVPLNKMIIDENGKSFLDIKLTRALEELLSEDNGPSIELYFRCKHNYSEVKINVPLLEKDYLEVQHSKRNIFIKPASKNYNFPQLLDNDGNFVLFLNRIPIEIKFDSDNNEENKVEKFKDFLMNESGGVTGDLNLPLESFYAVKLKISKEFEYSSKPNTFTTKIYEETYNITTGNSSKELLYEITEKTNIRIKKDSKQKFTEFEDILNKKKPIRDYFNIYDIGKLGWKGTQKALEIFGYIDYWDDVQSMWRGEKPKLYDAVGVPLDTAEMVGKITRNPFEIPLEVNAILFGLAVFEETIVADAIDEYNEFNEKAMMVDLENAKIKGLDAVRKLFDSNQLIEDSYSLIRDVPQQILNQIISGKRMEYDSISLDFGKYPETIQRYDLLFRKIENKKTNNYNYSLECIIIN